MSVINNSDFGKPVTATHKLSKQWNGGSRTWQPVPVKISGLFIGVRHLQSGYMAREYGEYCAPISDPYWVEHGDRIPAALIVESARKNPVYAPLDCVKIDGCRI